ncbi:MAG: phosphoribosyl-ATP diphosphatase, partial [Myxococcota bacterium]
TGRSIVDGMAELREHVGGFLVTFVEREGRLQGTDLERVKGLVEAAGDARLTIAGGVSTVEEVRELDALGADAQVGMALYTGRFTIGQAVAGMLSSDRPDGLVPTVVADDSGVALGLAYSSADTLAEAIDTRAGVYHSRRRGRWKKGETSGAVQELLAVDLDCDRDSVRFKVRQTQPGFCHLDTWTCFGDATGVPELARMLASRVASAPEGSYTRRLLDDPGLLAAKLREEATELADAETPHDVAHEVADVVYFALVAMVRKGVTWSEVEAVLDRRSRRVTRRPGNAKP